MKIHVSRTTKYTTFFNIFCANDLRSYNGNQNKNMCTYILQKRHKQVTVNDDGPGVQELSIE